MRPREGGAALPDLILKALLTKAEVPEEHRLLLTKGTMNFTRKEKKTYRLTLVPRLEQYHRALTTSFSELSSSDPGLADTWAASIAFNIMSRGFATVADTLGMEVIGRRKVSDIIKSFRRSVTPDPG